MDAQVVYWIGFFVALAFIVFGADDLLWDVFALFRGIGKKRVKLSLINEKPPKMLAVVIAAWHEDAVIGEVVDNLVASAQYPRSLYRVFLGVYPNDAEDVVHPNEFKMTNYLIDEYDALQFPVFPLQRMPRLRQFFKTLTSSTYADEFAEHHFRTMVMRDELGFVPSPARASPSGAASSTSSTARTCCRATA